MMNEIRKGAIVQVHLRDGTYKTVIITSETPDTRDVVRAVRLLICERF